MGRSADWLSAEGVAVLAWVGDGCPDPGTTTDEIGRRITASALAKRGLISVTGRGVSWAAAITPAGLEWLGSHPQAVSIQVGRTDDLADQVSDLIARVVASHGPVPVPDGDESRALHERLVELSHGSPDRPRGRRLRLRPVEGWYHVSRYEVALVRYAGDPSQLPAVPVPDHVARYHPAVRTFLDAGSRYIGKEHRIRAARILQAVADEALRRGMVVSAPQVARTTGWGGQDETRRGHLVLRTSAGLYPIRIRQLTDLGKLELIVDGPGTAYRGDRYRDTARITLEQRLPGLFLDLETHRVEIERQELERLRREEERERRWEAAMADARSRFDEQQRWAAFERASVDWRAASQHREFLAVAREAAGRYEGPERADLVLEAPVVRLYPS